MHLQMCKIVSQHAVITNVTMEIIVSTKNATSLDWAHLPKGSDHNLTLFLPPALAEEVIFSVASVCLSVCLRSAGWTVGPKDLKLGTHIHIYIFFCLGSRVLSTGRIIFSLFGQIQTTDRLQTERKRCTWAHRPSCTGGLKNHILRPGDLNLWPMTLNFNNIQDVIKVDLHTEY